MGIDDVSFLESEYFGLLGVRIVAQMIYRLSDFFYKNENGSKSIRRQRKREVERINKLMKKFEKNHPELGFCASQYLTY